MYKIFDSINELYNELERDKTCSGAGSAVLNRYPLRFVLFENFDDFNAFTRECPNRKIYVQSIENIAYDEGDDTMMTYSQLATLFENFVKGIENDVVLAPFSEIARFYDNNEEKEFDSLLKTIRLIEATAEGQRVHQRIYVPIIGMQNKISSFINDPNINIWECKKSSDGGNYHLILTCGTTYGVKDLSQNYNICQNVRDWISLWKQGGKIKERIICSSKSIYNCSEYAQPDNAFDYTICKNAYEFLTKGLKLNFGNIQFKEEESIYWEQLAAHVDVETFNFEDFVKDQLKAFSLETEVNFVEAWFNNVDDYKRWLLKNYFLSRHGQETYLSSVFDNFETLSEVDFLSNLATQIFDLPFNDIYIAQRLAAIEKATGHNNQIKQVAEERVKTQLEEIATTPERGYFQAMKYMTPLTNSEKTLMVKWLGEGHIKREDIKELFPDLFYYTEPLMLQFKKDERWINDYFDEYRKSKISNTITSQLSEILNDKNSSLTKFSQWKNSFNTVKTYLYDRTDIDVYYWIDGLGIDWIPYLRYIIGNHSANDVFINEILIATAELPTTTKVNKVKLEEFAKDKLKKIGDLDKNAHASSAYPHHILEEFQILSKSINDILSKYNGKKIAFVSDHGISYLAAMSEVPLNLGGYISKHSGRYAIADKGDAYPDEKYIILEDKKTICSLTHQSLSNKTPEGTGAHGGATPEEVLVPILIVSNSHNASNYSVTLLDNKISATLPCVRYEIKGLSNVDTPKILYNGVEYDMENREGNIYVSKRLNLVETVTTVSLVIGEFNKTDKIKVKIGIEEEDLFGDL